MKGEESEIYKANVNKLVSRMYKQGTRKSEVEGVIIYELEEPEEFLNWAVLNNFLLHGSTREILEDLMPYQANDKVKESGNRKAIYITRVPAVAMFCALTGGVDGLARKHNSHTTIEKGIVNYKNMYFGVSDKKMVADKGYIYLLGKNQIDEEINGEYLAYTEICPLAVIEIEKKDFPFKISSF